MRTSKISKKDDEREKPNVKEEFKVHIVKVEKKTKATKKEEIKINIVKVEKTKATKKERLRRRRLRSESSHKFSRRTPELDADGHVSGSRV